MIHFDMRNVFRNLVCQGRKLTDSMETRTICNVAVQTDR